MVLGEGAKTLEAVKALEAENAHHSRRCSKSRQAGGAGGEVTFCLRFGVRTNHIAESFLWRTPSTQRHRRTRSLPRHRDKTHRVCEEENVHGCCEDAGRRA